MFQGVPFSNGKTCPMSMLPPGALGTSLSPLSILIICHKPLKHCRNSSPAKPAAQNTSTPPVLSNSSMLAGIFISKPAVSGNLQYGSRSAAHSDFIVGT